MVKGHGLTRMLTNQKYLNLIINEICVYLRKSVSDEFKWGVFVIKNYIPISTEKGQLKGYHLV